MQQEETEELIGKLGVTILGKGDEQEVVSGIIVDTSTVPCDGIDHMRVGIELHPPLPGGRVLDAPREKVLVGD